MKTCWPHSPLCLKKEDRCNVYSNPGWDKRFLSNNISQNALKYRSTWPKYASVRNQAALGRIQCWNLNVLAVPRCSCLHQYLLTYIPSFAANLRRSFGIQQTLVEKETWRRGEGPRESGWATPRPHVPSPVDKDRVYTTNASHGAERGCGVSTACAWQGRWRHELMIKILIKTNWKQGVWKGALRWSNRYLIEYLIDSSSF